MCGIWGKYYFDTARRIPRGLPLRMCNSLSHRGPDQSNYIAQGNIAFGVRRLGIIDLEKGDQPVRNEDGNIMAVFNGEIYNHKELKEYLAGKGHCLSSKCDSEVIPHLYEELGVKFVEKLRGMFALGLWDQRGRLLLLARDRLGIKPLFYSLDKNCLTFASEIKSILEDRDIRREIDMEGINHYLTYNYIPSFYTIFKNIKKLLPGSYLICSEAGEAAVNKYWEVNYNKNFYNLARAEEKFINLFEDTVKEHLETDVPWGIFLSGGLDSSSLVHFIKNHKQSINTFNLDFRENTFGEGEFSRLVSDYFNTAHYETCIGAKECAEQLREITKFLDNPIGEPSVIPTYFLAKFAKNYIRVAFSGEGADELLCGYHTYQADILAKYYRLLPGPAQRIINYAANKFPADDRYLPLSSKIKIFTHGASMGFPFVHFFWRQIFSTEEKERLLNYDYLFELKKNKVFNDPVGIYLSYFHEADSSDYLEKCMYADLKVWLPDSILYRVDAMSMANSIEVRVPYLDHYLVEFLFGLPLKYKILHLQTKYLLRRAMANKLPSLILRKKKHGFSVPVSYWLKNGLKDILLVYLNEKEIKKTGIFNYAFIRRLMEDHAENKSDNGRKLWNLLMLFVWFERFNREFK